jgi:hypothetical protein
MLIAEERRAAGRVLLIGIFSAQAMLLAFSLKLRAGAALRGDARGGGGARANGAAAAAAADAIARSGRAGGGGGGAPDFFGLCGGGLASLGSGGGALPGAGGIALRRLAREGLGWVPTACNACALLTFAGGLIVNHHVTGGEPEAVLLLAPLLLLLSQDPVFFPALGEQQRYFPPVAAVTACLAGAAGHQVAGWGLRLRDAGFWALNGGLLLLALPVHVVFLYHMWHQKPQPLAALAVLGPLCVLSLMLTQLETVRYLAGIGLVMGLLMFFNVRQLRQRGMKMV